MASLRSEGTGLIGAFAREEGLYYSAVRNWTELPELDIQPEDLKLHTDNSPAMTA